MENNIFEGAKFGDKFVTRGGQKCLIIEPPYKINDVYRIDYIVKGESGIVSCDINGHVTDVESDWDIVSRYQETIDENKLDELARDFSTNTNIHCNDYGCYYWDDVIEGFKAGYRKAREE